MSPEFPNIPTPTLGGGPSWEEVAQVGEYRIQRNRVTGHFRLLDGANVRRAWGTQESCEGVLARLLNQTAVPKNPNMPMPTLGGMQFWGDELVHCGWRIQRNVFTGHCRLLDSRNVRQAWGTFEQCEVAMRRLHEAAGLEPAGERIAILLHGILGWKDGWSRQADELRRRGFEPVGVNYPSTRQGIERHVDQLAMVIENLPEHEEINFVVHSMGGLIVRRLLADHPEIRVHRLVMIATPNHGALTADMVADWFAFQLVFGASGQQLVSGANAFVRDLPPPPCEFGVIAGGRGDGVGYNPLLPGDNDGVVEVASTRLEGMSDFMVAAHMHSLIFRAPEVAKAAADFLESGRFQA